MNELLEHPRCSLPPKPSVYLLRSDLSAVMRNDNNRQRKRRVFKGHIESSQSPVSISFNSSER